MKVVPIETLEITQIDDILINGVIFDVDVMEIIMEVSVHPSLGGSVSGGSPNSTNPYITILESFGWSWKNNNLTMATYTLV